METNDSWLVPDQLLVEDAFHGRNVWASRLGGAVLVHGEVEGLPPQEADAVRQRLRAAYPGQRVTDEGDLWAVWPPSH
ncbi:hypothetical protein [Streptomyces sp. NPDC005438]|uniref:hypothetical protein n=1 Tax=Streptomyces sp. NPDC005438 TaxID=3156880 RepID=UPI0033B8200E